MRRERSGGAHSLPVAALAGTARAMDSQGALVMVGWIISCLAAARSMAPRPAVHRIRVTPGILRWSLVLADAARCLLGEVVRSGIHARGEPLGSFIVFAVIVLSPAPLAIPWAVLAAATLMSNSAPYHPSPVGQTGGTSLNARTTTCLAEWPNHITRRPFSRAGAPVGDCTAYSSPARADQTAWLRRAPAADASQCDGTHPTALRGAPRLAARGATVANWLPASAEASSQTGDGSGGGRRRRGEAGG